MRIECRGLAVSSRRLLAVCFLLALTVAPAAPAAQAPGAPATAQPPPITGTASIEPSNESITLYYSNRPITVLRARVLGRQPSERAAIAERLLDDLIAQRIAGPVAMTPVEGGRVITVGGRVIIGLTPLDTDDGSAATLEADSGRIVETLQLALNEALEARTPLMLLRAVVSSLLVMAIGVALLIMVARGRRRITGRLMIAAERHIARVGEGSLEMVRASRILEFWKGVISFLSIVVGLFVVYAIATFTLRQFPYTRPWGESMRSFMLSKASGLALDMVNAIPSLFTVILIVLVARFVSRLIQLFFRAIEERRLEVPWLHPDTAQPSRRLVNSLLWIFAAVMAYPYFPGSGTDAFKGASVFLGVVLSLGSSGLVNQMMSSFMITYSRALRVGDYVRVADIEGTVIHLGVLSTKVRTPRGEHVTIPNAIVVSNTTTNYSGVDGVDGVLVATSVTIGYDTPWRQVESLLLMAAERTPSVRQSPPPVVRQSELQDFYVKYTLLVCPERPERRHEAMSVLHANILDAFNEYGVQITSPNYEADPHSPKIVPRSRWYEAPAKRD